MKNIFLSIAVATAIYASAQNPAEANRALNRASEWSKASAMDGKKIDSSKLVKKTITQEIALPKALDILIDMTGELTINTWNENKIKMETTVQFEAPNELSDSQWLDRLGIHMKVFGSTVRVKSKSNNALAYITTSNGTRTLLGTSSPVFYSNGSYLNVQKGDRPVTLYIPAESILEIENKYGHLKINNNIKSLLLDNSDGEIAFANIGKLQLRSNRGSFNGGIITEGDIELAHGRLSLKQLDKGSITSNYSTIEIESLKDVKLNCSNDEIDIDNAYSLHGVKNYGNLRINQLLGKLDIQGINSDIKLRHINPSAQLVKIVNRNADLRLPSNDLSSFSVDVKGSYNKIYSSFAENTIVDTLTAREIESIKAITNTVNTAGATIGSVVTVAGRNKNLTEQNTYLAEQNDFLVRQNALTGVTSSERYQTAGRAQAGATTVGTNKQNPYLKYTAKIGSAGEQLRYEITCTSCVIDFK